MPRYGSNGEKAIHGLSAAALLESLERQVAEVDALQCVYTGERELVFTEAEQDALAASRQLIAAAAAAPAPSDHTSSVNNNNSSSVNNNNNNNGHNSNATDNAGGNTNDNAGGTNAGNGLLELVLRDLPLLSFTVNVLPQEPGELAFDVGVHVTLPWGYPGTLGGAGPCNHSLRNPGPTSTECSCTVDESRTIDASHNSDASHTNNASCIMDASRTIDASSLNIASCTIDASRPIDASCTNDASAAHSQGPRYASPAVRLQLGGAARWEQEALQGAAEDACARALGMECVLDIVAAVQDSARSLSSARHQENAYADGAAEGPPPKVSKLPVIERRLIWFHHIKSLAKRKLIVAWGDELAVTGVCKPGYPGVLVIEGEPGSVAEYVDRLHGLRWKAMAVRGEVTERGVEGQVVGDLRKFGGAHSQRSITELMENGMSELATMCREAGLESLFLTAMKIQRPGV